MGFKTLRQLLQAATNPNDRQYNSSKAYIVPWDTSKNPKDNKKRADKLGSGDQSHGQSFVKFDKNSKKITPADGINAARPSRAVLEPDAWVLRLHEKKGEGIDNCWAPRLITDHNNKHNEREMRSIMVMDQRRSQHWGTLAEVFWVKDVTAVLTQDELRFDSAGFLRSVTGAKGVATGKDPKYHTCINTHKFAGYTTDSERIGQWHQLFTYIPLSKASPTGLKVREFDFPCDTIDADILNETIDGKVTNKDGDKFAEKALWADATWFQGKTKIESFAVVGNESTGVVTTTEKEFFGPLGIDPIPDGCPTGFLIFGGHHWTDRKAGSKTKREFADAKNPDTGKKESEIEDSPKFPEKTDKNWLRIWGRAPNNYCPPTCSPYDNWVPTGETEEAQPPRNTGEELPVGDSPRTPGWGWEYEKLTLLGLVFHAPIPQFPGEFTEESAVGAIVNIPMMVRAAIPGGEQIDVTFLFRTRPKCTTRDPEPLIEINRTLTNADLNEKNLCVISFEVSAQHFALMDGGILEMGFFQRSSSTATVNLITVGPEVQWQFPGPASTFKAPNAPLNLDQLDASLVSIPKGGSTPDTTITFEADISDPNSPARIVTLEVEVILTSASFESIASGRSSFVSPGETVTVAIPGLASGTYKWRARVLNSAGVITAWFPFGDPSFTIT